MEAKLTPDEGPVFPECFGVSHRMQLREIRLGEFFVCMKAKEEAVIWAPTRRNSGFGRFAERSDSSVNISVFCFGGFFPRWRLELQRIFPT